MVDKAEILEVMVLTDPDLAGDDTIYTEPISGYAITYETMLPIGGNAAALSDYAACFLFSTTGQGQATTLCQRTDQVADCVCPDTDLAGNPIECAQSGALIGRCVATSTGAIPTAQKAAANGASIRLIVGKLLEGSTLEHFACACQGTEITALDPANCGSGGAWSDDPNDCGVCGDGAQGNEAGRCLDTDTNNLPDVSSLKVGVATITCTGQASCPTTIPGWSGSAASCVYESQEGDGYFYPSGNLFQSSFAGFGGVGPAIVINPASPLPTGADCSIVIADFVKFESGEGLSIAGTPTWHTTDLSLALVAPEDTFEIPVNSTTRALEVTVGANAPLGSASLTVNVLDTDPATNATVTLPEATNATADIGGTTATATFPAILVVDKHIYTVNVTGTVTDEFGQSLTLDEASELSVNTTAAIAEASKR